MRDRRLPLIGIASCAIGVVIGFALGGLGPRLELEGRDEEIARLTDRLEEQRPGGWRAPIPGLDRILRAPAPERSLPPVGGGEEPSGEPAERQAGQRSSGASDGGVPVVAERTWREGWRDRTPTERLAGFRRAASLQRVRRVQSRAALIQQADLDEPAQAELDDVLREMNEALYGHGEELVWLAMSDEPPAARDLLGVTHDLTGIMHRAQLRVEEIVGPRADDVDPSALEIWNHVDLAQLEPAAAAAMRGPF